VKISCTEAGDVAVPVRPARCQPDRGDVGERPPDGPHQQHREPDAEQQRRSPLSAQHLDDGVRAVAADEHQHEQEQHHHGARVDDDLHEAEEHRPLGHVEHAQREHRAGQAQRRVHGVAGEHHAQRAGERDRAEDPERHRLAAAGLGATGQVRLLGELQHEIHRLCSPTASGTSERRASVGPCT
jgi:hypothetical protein